ncbi:transposase [Accumulibacter sp.]|uniref:REP-associated tyrosine transposase n=1 Tax=Accumulibacter sp. TaxID=2053492 RepID=UPI0026089339|nr:transposase [Accumulibacter sp.]
MARPLRIEFPGALYHVTSRGDRLEPIYEDDEDRQEFLRVLAEVVGRYHWLCHAWCLMTNHYHLLIETVEGNLSKGMRHLNGVYTQASNRRHHRSGHLFQGRFKGILVDQDAYLLELSRYVVLNPVRARMVDAVEQWPWSSYPAMVGEAPVPEWMDTDRLLSEFGADHKAARQRYRHFVREGAGQEVWAGLRQQIYLGDKQFVERMQTRARVRGDELTVPKAQRRLAAASLGDIAAGHGERNAAIAAAYATGAYSYREIAAHFGVHLATVGRVVRGMCR